MTQPSVRKIAALAALLSVTFACHRGDSAKTAPVPAAGADGAATVVAKLNGSDILASELET